MPHSSDADLPPPATSGVALGLAETLATRLCHDLAGMLGALSGALELMSDDLTMVEEALPVARDAAVSLGHRLRLLRAAWGRSEVTLGMAELRALTLGLPTGRRVSVVLDGLPATRVFRPGEGRLLLNLLMLAVESLAGAGEVAVLGETSGDVMVRLDGPRASWPAGFALMLADRPTAVQAASSQGPREIQMAFTALLAHDSGVRASLLMAPDGNQAAPVLLCFD